jgi:hypothetical protein
MTNMMSRLIALAMVALVTACRSGWLVVEPVATSVQRPSQVAVYLSVRSGDAPVTDLTTASFSISENGERLDATAVDLSLLERKVAAEHHTVLLLDASNIAPGSEGETVMRAAESFVRKVAASQRVSVYAFDGSEALRTIAEAYGPVEEGDGVRRDAESTKAEAGEATNGAGEPIKGEAADPLQRKDAEPSQDAAQSLKLEAVAVEDSDPSRDLHGAILRGLDKLEQTLSRAVKPVRVGTLVVFTRGPDLAGRISASHVDERLDEMHAAVVAISVGGDESSRIQQIGRDGLVRAATIQKLEQAFEQAADRVLALERSHYLLTYCSPARAGERKLSIEVTMFGRKEPVTGSVDTRFDAQGFTSGCDAQATPHFVVTLVPGDRGTIPAAVPAGVEAAPSEPGSADKPAAAPPKPAAPPAAKRTWRPPPSGGKKPAPPPPPREPSGPPPTDFEP